MPDFSNHSLYLMKLFSRDGARLAWSGGNVGETRHTVASWTLV